MKALKRKIAVLLAAVMLLALPVTLSGCNESGLIKIVIYSQTANSSGNQVGWAAEILKEKFGVEVMIVNEKDGTFATRMSTGDLGDIVIFGSSGNQYRDAVEASALFDWEEDDLLKEFGPYIYENMQLALEKNRELNGNGKVHGFGFDVASNADDHDAHIYYPYLRWDLYEELGKPEIETLEDFIPILLAMQELEPESQIGTKTYAVSSFPDWDGDMVMMVKSTAALYGWEEFGVGLYNVIDQTFQGALDEDGMYLRCLRFYNQLNQLGLFDPDSMTQTFESATQKYRNGVSFFNIFTFVAETFNSDENLEAGRALQCIPANDQLNLVNGLNVYGKNRVWAIGAKTNYPELCMEIINWFATPEGVLAYNYGPQGVTWDYDENGNTYLTETGLASRKSKRNTMIEINGNIGNYRDGEFQHNNTTWSMDSVNPESALGETYNWKFWESTFDSKILHPVEQRWQDWADGARTGDELLRNRGMVAVSIGTKFELGRRDAELDTTWEQVKKCIVDASWEAIYATNDVQFNAIVNKMIRDARAFGYDECIAWVESEAERRRTEEDRVRAELHN
jgi:multiple sugar transport system substrate-binding protein/putative aldouronate transport system substrate-binding protein